MKIKIRINVDLKVGRVVKYFIFVDLALIAGWGLIDPIFAVFVKDHIAGATLVTVGFAAAIYWLLKSLLQIPLANRLDRTKGEKDDFYMLILGLLIVSFAAVLFGFVREVWQLYAIQILKAFGFACYSATWPAIFSRHLDKERVSFDWAMDSTAVGISAGVSGFLGGLLANTFGFTATFVLGGALSFISAIVLLMVPDLMLPPKTMSEPLRQDHTPTDIGR